MLKHFPVHCQFFQQFDSFNLFLLHCFVGGWFSNAYTGDYKFHTSRRWLHHIRDIFQRGVRYFSCYIATRFIGFKLTASSLNNWHFGIIIYYSVYVICNKSRSDYYEKFVFAVSLNSEVCTCRKLGLLKASVTVGPG